jgi:hypothetical protein
MGFLRTLFTQGTATKVKEELDYVQLIYAFTMSHGAYTEIAKGYRDSIREHGAKRTPDFFPLACMIDGSQDVYKPLPPVLHTPKNQHSMWLTQPLGPAQVQFTIVVPGQPYEHREQNGTLLRMRIDKVLVAFQKGEFRLPQAVLLPFARMRIEPFSPPGVWY